MNKTINNIGMGVSDGYSSAMRMPTSASTVKNEKAYPIVTSELTIDELYRLFDSIKQRRG